MSACLGWFTHCVGARTSAPTTTYEVTPNGQSSINLSTFFGLLNCTMPCCRSQRSNMSHFRIYGPPDLSLRNCSLEVNDLTCLPYHYKANNPASMELRLFKVPVNLKNVIEHRHGYIATGLNRIMPLLRNCPKPKTLDCHITVH